jgi:5'-nucleotidase
VDGTPCDCITLALDKLLKSKPDLIISGIDFKNNCGDTIYCSGVVSAAMESAIQGIKSIAVSTRIKDKEDEKSYIPAARLIAKKLDYFVSLIQKNGYLNINCPEKVNSKKLEITHLTTGLVNNKYSVEVNPFGKNFAWLKDASVATGVDTLGQKGDVYWLKQGYSTVTPLKLDLINVPAISIVKEAGIKIADSLPAVRKGEIKKYE